MILKNTFYSWKIIMLLNIQYTFTEDLFCKSLGNENKNVRFVKWKGKLSQFSEISSY
jgi:hypothetical protein